jgi:hypothetical protein
MEEVHFSTIQKCFVPFSTYPLRNVGQMSGQMANSLPYF